MSSPEGPSIWTYWEDVADHPRPPYLGLCLETVRRHAGSLPVRLIHPGNVQEWLGPLRPEWDQLSVVHRSDYVRTRLVHRHGGLWFDLDTIALAPLDPIMATLDGEVTFVGCEDDGLHVGFFAANAGCPLLGDWIARQDRLLDDCADPGNLIWDALGADLLRPAAQAAPLGSVKTYGAEVMPVGWRDWEIFLSITYPKSRVLRSSPPFVVLYNSSLQPHVRGDADLLLRRRTLLARLLRVGLGLSPRTSTDPLDLLAPVGDLWRVGRRSIRARARRVGTRLEGAVRRTIGLRLVPWSGAITRVETNERAVALTFDDGPDPVFTPRLLDVLEARGAKATFFLVGEHATEHPELVDRIVAAGHTVGSHGWQHRSTLTGTLGPGLAAERDLIRRGADAVGRHASEYYRPPFGHRSRWTQLAATSIGLQVVGWSDSSRDWSGDSAEVVASRMKDQLRPGSIVLLHDGLENAAEPEFSDRRSTVDAVDKLLGDASDWRFVSLAELLTLGPSVRRFRRRNLQR